MEGRHSDTKGVLKSPVVPVENECSRYIWPWPAAPHMPETQLNCPSELGAGSDEAEQLCSSSSSEEDSLASKGRNAEGLLLLSFCFKCSKQFFDHGPCFWSASKCGFLSLGCLNLPSALQFSSEYQGDSWKHPLSSAAFYSLLWGSSKRLLPELYRARMRGSASQAVPAVVPYSTASSHSSLSPKSNEKNRWIVEGFHRTAWDSGKAIMLSSWATPWPSSICTVARVFYEAYFCYLPFGLPATQIQQMDLMLFNFWIPFF